MLKLQFKDQRKPAIWLVEQRYAIGKDPQNTIVLQEDGVSPFHAEIRVEGEQVFISDTGSANGTFVNEKRIARRTELRAQDVIRVHSVEFLLVDPKQESSHAPEGATAITPALANIPVTPSSAAKGESGWSLKAKTGSIVGKTYAIPAVGKVVIGRATVCDIQLPANHVSRQHAEVHVADGRLLVRDLHSANGTYINRKKIMDGELKPGDEVRFDTFSFEVSGPGATKATATATAIDNNTNTQFRAPPPAPAPRVKSDAPAPSKPAAAPVSSTSATTTGKKVVEDEKQGGGAGLIIALVVLALVGAAWFLFLK